MINTRDARAISLHFAGLVLGIFGLIFVDSAFYHNFYVIVVSIILLLSIAADKAGWIRPYSFLILSFFVFVWMRYLLNIIFGTDIISIGDGINSHNTNLVAIWLGFSMNIICIISIIASRTFGKKIGSFYTDNSGIRVPGYAEYMILIVSLIFFSIFLADSIRKISIVQMHNYLNVSETILTQGYRWFSLGKWSLLIWIIMGRDENRFFKGSTIMAVAGIGYLMRGARGYAIMYMFLWLLFFSQKRKIRITTLVIIGVGLLYLANFVLSYRIGWSVASRITDIIKSTLYQQGASVEPVFGSVIFREQIMTKFSVLDLWLRNDYGIIVDRMRGIRWETGGFGSSFFAEAYFLGFPFNIIVLIVAGICVGFVECSYQFSKVKSRKGYLADGNKMMPMCCAEYANIILFMTIPNLVYLGRSSIKDFITKTILVLIILSVLRGHSGMKYRRSCCV